MTYYKTQRIEELLKDLIEWEKANHIDSELLERIKAEYNILLPLPSLVEGKTAEEAKKNILNCIEACMDYMQDSDVKHNISRFSEMIDEYASQFVSVAKGRSKDLTDEEIGDFLWEFHRGAKKCSVHFQGESLEKKYIKHFRSMYGYIKGATEQQIIDNENTKWLLRTLYAQLIKGNEDFDIDKWINEQMKNK